MKKTTTKNMQKTVKMLVYGPAGSGKTRLCATAPKPLIISCEGGLMSIADYNLPVWEIETIGDIEDALNDCTKKKARKKFETICLDSISDMAEVVLAEYKADCKDPRKAYGNLNDTMADILRSFRGLPYNVVITAKEKRFLDSGFDVRMPSMPGKALVELLPYMYDLVGHMEKIDMDDEEYVAVRCQLTEEIYAKDRSGRLNKFEEPDLIKMFAKILKRK